MSYKDNDGLLRKFGTEKATANTGGDYKTYGALREIELRIDMSTLTSSPAILNDLVFFEKSRIEEVVIECHTAIASAGGGTFNIGLVRTSDRTTEIDFDGFIAAEVVATFNTAGKKVTYVNGTSKAGALIGTTTTNVGHITADWDTAAFESGILYVRIRYRAD